MLWVCLPTSKPRPVGAVERIAVRGSGSGGAAVETSPSLPVGLTTRMCHGFAPHQLCGATMPNAFSMTTCL